MRLFVSIQIRFREWHFRRRLNQSGRRVWEQSRHQGKLIRKEQTVSAVTAEAVSRGEVPVNSWWEYLDRDPRKEGFALRLAVFRVVTRTFPVRWLSLCVYVSPESRGSWPEMTREVLEKMDKLSVAGFWQLVDDGFLKRIDSPQGL